MKRPDLLGPVRDYRAEILAWLDRAEKCVNPPGGYYGNASGDDLRPEHALPLACLALRAIVRSGSVSDHHRIAKAMFLDDGKAGAS